MKKKTILVVDDTITNLDILVELLDGYDVIEAANGVDALEIVSEELIDLILLDIMMPDMDGFEVCQKLKSNEDTKDIPIIFITAKADEDSIEQAYDMGGIDYITKPFKPKELLARVKRELKMQALIHDLEASQEELKILASTDPMTKLYNRRYFSKISEHILNLAKRDDTYISIMMLDIDKFKNVNDTCGHKVGDDVIITLASSLQQFTRKSDIVCRFGGEEFLILLPKTNIDGAVVIAQNIREAVESLVVNIECDEKPQGDKELKITVSIGVSQINNKEDINIEASIKRADMALYKAKKSGRNRVCRLVA
ncbi:MAG: diguanylate cyclase [Pseudomonadota bacterium]